MPRRAPRRHDADSVPLPLRYVMPPDWDNAPTAELCRPLSALTLPWRIARQIEGIDVPDGRLLRGYHESQR